VGLVGIGFWYKILPPHPTKTLLYPNTEATRH
jgi:hypothetical protein